jgi:hypothetical protein
MKNILKTINICKIQKIRTPKKAQNDKVENVAGSA